MGEWLQMGAVDIELFTLWALENMQSGLNQLCPSSSYWFVFYPQKEHLPLCWVESWLLTHHMHITNQLFLYTKNYMKYFYIWTFTSMQGGSFFARQGWLLCKCYFRQPCKRRQSPNFAFQRKPFPQLPTLAIQMFDVWYETEYIILQWEKFWYGISWSY